MADLKANDYNTDRNRKQEMSLDAEKVLASEKDAMPNTRGH